MIRPFVQHMHTPVINVGVILHIARKCWCTSVRVVAIAVRVEAGERTLLDAHNQVAVVVAQINTMMIGVVDLLHPLWVATGEDTLMAALPSKVPEEVVVEEVLHQDLHLAVLFEVGIVVSCWTRWMRTTNQQFLTMTTR